MADYSKEELKELIQNARHKKIALIKAYRHFTNKDLRESIEAIESCNYEYNSLIELFEEFIPLVPRTLSKDEFMEMISDAIDNRDIYMFDGMLQAVDVLIRNCKNNGGLEAIAEKRERFLRAL